ncbi:MAG: hypothetical protein EGR78_09590 [Erysipelotrichaceae bacterium]|nr:hypothetical protein [Erysipelotrichaceae bacterium]
MDDIYKKYLEKLNYEDLLKEYVVVLKKSYIDSTKSLFTKYSDQIVKTYFDYLKDTDSYKNLVNNLNYFIKENIIISHDTLSKLSKQYISTIDYSSVYITLVKNINTIYSIFDNLENEDNENIESKIYDINFNITYPADISIAKMEAEINGEEYIEPDLDYKKFNVLLSTMSFIDDPVKATNILSQLIYFADHSVDMSFKVQIYSALKEQIAILIAGGIIGIAILVIGILLDYFLKDNEIYKKFIELKDSIKKVKK